MAVVQSGPAVGARRLSRAAASADRLVKILLPVAVLAFVIAGWQAYTASGDSPLTPTPRQVLDAAGDVLTSSQAWSALADSDYSLLLGFAIAVVVFIPVGIVMGRWRALDRALSPYLDIAIVTPMAALMPVVLLAIGLNRTAEVVVIVIFAAPFVATATRAGTLAIPGEWVEMSHSFGSGELRTWRLVLIPASISSIVSGLRLGFAQALTGLVTVELTLISLGIGKRIQEYKGTFQNASLFAFILLIAAQSLLVMSLLTWLERRVGGKQHEF